MGYKVGIDKETWDSVVGSQEAVVSGIKPLSAKELDKTNLQRFENLVGLETKFNSVLGSLKTYTQSSTAKMRNAGNIIVQEDNNQSKAIQGNAQSIRFK